MRPTMAAILAGGRSERMGRDKAELRWQGETLLARTVRIAQEAGCRAVVIGRERPPHWPDSVTVFVPDALPQQGPLGGLSTALEIVQNSGEEVLALACDMPLLSAEVLRWLRSQEVGTHGVLVQNAEQWEPLFSVYTSAALGIVQRQLATGRRSLQSLRQAGGFRQVLLPTRFAESLRNVNTPEELAALAYG